MNSIDTIILGFAVLNIAWNMKESRKKPIQSLIFGLLWLGLAVSIIFGIKLG